MKKILLPVLATFFLILAAGPIGATDSKTPDADVEKRFQMLELQMQQQSEQNKQMLELMKSMSQDKASALPGTDLKSASPGGEPKPAPSALAKKETPQAAKPTEAEIKTKYVPGWRATVYSLEPGFDLTSGLPKTELGRFITKKSSHDLMDYVDPIGINVGDEAVIWQGEAFLEAKVAGNYIFSLLLGDPRGPGGTGKNYGEILIENVSIGSGINKTIVGAAELEPGLYKVEFRVASGVRDNLQVSNRSNSRRHGTFSMLIKRPEGNKPVPISEVLLIEKAAK